MKKLKKINCFTHEKRKSEPRKLSTRKKCLNNCPLLLRASVLLPHRWLQTIIRRFHGVIHYELYEIWWFNTANVIQTLLLFFPHRSSLVCKQHQCGCQICDWPEPDKPAWGRRWKSLWCTNWVMWKLLVCWVVVVLLAWLWLPSVVICIVSSWRQRRLLFCLNMELLDRLWPEFTDSH